MIKKGIDRDLLTICKDILQFERSLSDWEKHESSDQFQIGHYSGGFDAIESAFCFSWYDSQNNEFWFQITLEEVKQILAGKKQEIEIRKAE